MTKYIIHLSYENACKAIDFAETCGLYSHITYGGVVVQDLTDELLAELTVFLKNLKVRYEITEQAPHIREGIIVKSLKESGIIKT